MSIVEVMAAMALVTSGLLGLMAVFTNASRVAAENEQRDLLSASLRSVVESLQSVPFETIPKAYGLGSGRGLFWCAADGTLSYNETQDATYVGVVEIFDDEWDVPTSFPDAINGLDLNGNGVIDSGPIVDYLALPVRITIQRNDSANGTTQGEPILTSEFLLMERDAR